MSKAFNGGPIAKPQPDDLKLRKLVVKLGNAYVGLSTQDRRKVLRLLERVIFGEKTAVSFWDRWSQEDMRACYTQLQPISQKIAKVWHRWASEHLKTGHNICLVVRCLMDELICRMWREEAQSETDE